MILAVGNPLRGDDGVGLFAGRLLAEKGFAVVFADASPENVMGQLSGRVVVLDAAEFSGNEPFRVAGPNDGGQTHGFSLAKIAKFTGAEMRVLGIKTYNRSLREGVSEQAQANARAAVKVIEVCMAIACKVLDKGTVDMDGEKKRVKSAVGELSPGELVLVHAGVAIERLSEEDYKELKEHADKLFS